MRSAIFALLIVSCSSTGCSKAHTPPSGDLAYGQRQADPEIAPSTVTSDNQRAQRDFDRAAAAWRSGDYPDAQQRFDSFLKDHPTDVLAPKAELWLVRTYVSRGDTDSARRALKDLAAHGADQEIRGTAEIYLAFVSQLDGDKREARAQIRRLIERQPDIHIVDGIVPEQDTPLMAAMLADTRLRQGEFLTALQDLEIVERSSSDDAMKAWAVSSGMTVARQVLEPEALDGLLRAESSFQRAIAVGARVHRALAEGQIEQGAQAFQLGGPALLIHDLEQEYVALQNTLALSGAINTPMFGLAVSLSGADRQAGQAALRGMFLAQRSFEPRPRSVDLLIEDTKGTRLGAREAVQALCDKGVPLIIGPIERGLVSTARNTAHACGAFYVGLETLADSNTKQVRMSLDAGEEARTLIQYAHTQGAQTIAIVTESPSAAFFEQMVDVANQEAQKRGMRVQRTVDVDIESLQSSSERAATQLVSAGVDAIVFAVSDSTMTALSSYLAAQGLWPSDRGRGKGPHYLGTSFAWSPRLALNSGRYVQGMVFASWLPESLPRTQAFRSSFESTFGSLPGVIEAFAFDAANFARVLLLDVGAREGRTMQELLDAEFSFRGATGEWTWTASEQQHAPTLMRIDQGEPKSL